MHYLSTVVLVAACSAPVMAQCPYSVSTLNQWDMAGEPAFGAAQPQGAWTFWRSDQGRQLLAGVSGNGVPGTFWGASDQAFFVPAAGARYSPIPERNQIPFHRREPTFEGIMSHPGFSPIDLLCIFTPSGPGQLTSLTLRAEDLGQASPNVIVSATLESAGPSVQLIPPTAIAALAPAVTLTASGLPLAITSASRIVVRVNNGGDPSEDWLNLNATVTISGPPVAITPPIDTTACPGSTATLSVVPASGASVAWRRNGVPLQDGATPWGSVIAGTQTPVLTIFGATDADEAAYDTVLTNACGSGATASGDLTVLACCPDFNDDGNADQDDIIYLINVIGGGPNPTGRDADFNRDGNTDQDDVLSLINVVGGGDCP